VALTEYNSFEEFIEHEQPPAEKLFFFSRFAEKNYFSAHFTSGSYLIFGKETTGLPPSLSLTYPNHFYSLPSLSPIIRSINLSNAAAAVAFESIRQIHFSH
jgi:tRNA (cytidine/uridine-2'-O-)-methyltransferase